MKYLGILVALIGLALLGVSCGGGPLPVQPDETGTINITQAEFTFTPDNILFTVGSKVRIVLTNIGEQDHGFMIGHNVVTTEGFPDGYEVGFFDCFKVKVIGPAKRVVAGRAVVTREGGMIEEVEGHGFMVLQEPSSEATIIEFMVPNIAGDWEFGSFQHDGADYNQGMHGKLLVVGDAGAGSVSFRC